jgi:hypothetical protein
MSERVQGFKKIMQPISLQNRSLSSRFSLSGASALGQVQLTETSPSTVSSTGAGQVNFMPLLISMLQLATQMIKMFMGSQPLGADQQQGGTNAPGAGNYLPSSGEDAAPGKAKGSGKDKGHGKAKGPGKDKGHGKAKGPGKDKGHGKGNDAPPAADGIGSAAGMTIDERRALNYSDLVADPNGGVGYDNVRGGKQAFNGVSGRDAAIMHLGGRGHISAGTSANGVSGGARIYNNVLNNPQNFTPDEVALIQGYAAAEIQKYGYITGEGLDHDFVDQMAARGDISPEKRAAYHQAIDDRVARMVSNPDQAAVAREASQEVNIVSDIGTLEAQSGLTRYEQAVYRLAGHATLFSGDGTIDGDILAITLGNTNSLDGRSFGNQDTNIDPETLSLLQDDLAIDGELNGDALRLANEGVLDKIFMGGPGVTAQEVRETSVQQAQSNGRTQQDIIQSLQMSADQALRQFGSFVQDHPVVTAVGAGAMVAGSAVCPFLSGTLAVGAGIAAGSKMLSSHEKPAA